MTTNYEDRFQHSQYIYYRISEPEATRIKKALKRLNGTRLYSVQDRTRLFRGDI